MIPTRLSHLMAGLIPHARIRIYPDAAHGFLSLYPTEVGAEVNAFLAWGARPHVGRTCWLASAAR
jgi:hypothetical protein